MCNGGLLHTKVWCSSLNVQSLHDLQVQTQRTSTDNTKRSVTVTVSHGTIFALSKMPRHCGLVIGRLLPRFRLFRWQVGRRVFWLHAGGLLARYKSLEKEYGNPGRNVRTFEKSSSGAEQDSKTNGMAKEEL